MKLYPKFLLAGALALASAGSGFCAEPLRVLYFTKSAGFEHSVVKRTNGEPSYSEKVFSKLAETHPFVFTFSKDGSAFTPEYLAKFDVICFYTSGDLCSVGTDGNPAMTEQGKKALLDAIAGGKGFVGIHSCSDSFHTGEKGGGNNPKRDQRYHNYGDAADPFIKMLGGEFIRHGAQQVAAAKVIDPSFPGFTSLGSEVRVMEEWYTLKDFARNLHVLLLLNTDGMEGSDYQRPSFPLAWARSYGKGRVAFNAMGHREDVWDSAAFQSMLVGMLSWAGGTAKADVTPNLAQVAPGADTIQPLPQPTPPKS